MDKENPCIKAGCFFASCCHDVDVSRFDQEDLAFYPEAVYDPTGELRSRPDAPPNLYYGPTNPLDDGRGPFEGEIVGYCIHSLVLKNGVRVCGIHPKKPKFCESFKVGGKNCLHERKKDGFVAVTKIK